MWAAQQRNATASALAIFDAPLHIPVAREILGGGKADLLGRLPVVTAAKIGRALPVAAVLTPIDRKSVAEGKRVSVRVALGGRRIIQKQQKQIRNNRHLLRSPL